MGFRGGLAMVLVSFLVVGWIQALPSGSGWNAFFVDSKGQRKVFEPPLQDYTDGQWLALTFSDYAGPRIRLAVEVEEAAPSEFAEKVFEVLRQAHRFDVKGSADLGPERAQYRVFVGFETEGISRTASLRFRVVENASEQVVLTATESIAKERGSEGFSQALQVAVNRGGCRLALWLADRPWRGTVLAIEDDRVVIDAGRKDGLAAGMTLRALSRRESLIDPESGELIGAATKSEGTLEIISVEEHKAVAEVREHPGGLTRGDRVELLTEASPSPAL